MPRRPSETDDEYEFRTRMENMETDTEKKRQEIDLAAKMFDREGRKLLYTAFGTAAAMLSAGGGLMLGLIALLRYLQAKP